MDENKQRVTEAFGEISLSKEFVEPAINCDKTSPIKEPAKSLLNSQPTIVYDETLNDQPNVSKRESNGTVDINYNHLTDQQNDADNGDESARYDRHRRRSSRLTNLKSDLIESGAIFRPPFTPSNSLAKTPSSWRSPRGSIVEPTSGGMRSTSVGPGSRASSQASAPSLPPVPKNKKYANVQSRTVSHSDHKKPESQVRITHRPLKIEAKSKVGSLDKIGHQAGGGDKKILTQKLAFQPKPRVNSLANIQHVAGGGQNKIPSQKLDFKEKAQPRIDAHMDVQKLKSNGRDSSRSNNMHTSSNEAFNKTIQ